MLVPSNEAGGRELVVAAAPPTDSAIVRARGKHRSHRNSSVRVQSASAETPSQVINAIRIDVHQQRANGQGNASQSAHSLVGKCLHCQRMVYTRHLPGSDQARELYVVCSEQCRHVVLHRPCQQDMLDAADLSELVVSCEKCGGVVHVQKQMRPVRDILWQALTCSCCYAPVRFVALHFAYLSASMLLGMAPLGYVGKLVHYWHSGEQCSYLEYNYNAWASDPISYERLIGPMPFVGFYSLGMSHMLHGASTVFAAFMMLWFLAACTYFLVRSWRWLCYRTRAESRR